MFNFKKILESEAADAFTVEPSQSKVWLQAFFDIDGPRRHRHSEFRSNPLNTLTVIAVSITDMHHAIDIVIIN